ncbi:MAG: hypothetical protein AAF213_00745 [Pseudomonadota bacterium]
MLGKLLRRPGATEVALETAGLIVGTNTLKSPENGVMLAGSARKQAKKIEQVLTGDGTVIDPTIRQFLVNTHRAFSQLANKPSSVDAGVVVLPTPFAAHAELQEPNPEWAEQFDGVKAALAADAKNVILYAATTPSKQVIEPESPHAEPAVSQFFSKFLRKPDANTVALETVGLVRGDQEFRRFFDGTGGREAAAKQAERITTVLKSSAGVMDTNIRQFLIKARNAFEHLGEIPSAVPTRTIMGTPEALVQVHEVNPRWQATLDRTRSALAIETEAVLDTLTKRDGLGLDQASLRKDAGKLIEPVQTIANPMV